MSRSRFNPYGTVWSRLIDSIDFEGVQFAFYIWQRGQGGGGGGGVTIIEDLVVSYTSQVDIAVSIYL